MSFKAVELQIAVPRTVEHSRNQQIQQQQHALQSERMSEELAMQTERAEQTVTESDENARAELREQQEREARGSHTSKKRSDKQQDTEEAPHPYKGLRLDIKM
ncbi:MAG: hypothetical protein ACXVP5_08635 [Tumebacillaceae bacterium]